MGGKDKTALIVGGGIAGLSAAIALHQAGWAVRVLEQAAEISEIGAGIQISPNGMRALDALGVTDPLMPMAFEPDYIALRLGQGGRKIFEIPMRGIAQARWGHKFIQVHRGDLQNALRDRLKALAGDVIRTNARATGYVRERGGASVYVDGAEREFADLVVAADGVHSAMRTQLAGADRARFTGHVAWRCVVPSTDLAEFELPKGTTIWSGSGRHALTTRIRGGEMVNFVGIAEEEEWQEEGWNIPGDPQKALALFGDWNPLLPAILERAKHLHRWALLSRPPLASWRDGPVLLVGDAAHPMLPSMAQGAVQALEDAVVLGRMARPDAELSKALPEFERTRKPRVTRIQARSRQNLTLFHKKGAGARAVHFGALGLAGRLAPGAINGAQDWIYKFDPMA